MSEIKPVTCTLKRITPQEAAVFFEEEFKHQAGLSEQIGGKDIESLLADWALVGIYALEALIGIVGCDAEGETHIHITKAWQHYWQTRSIFVRALLMLFQEHEQLTSTIPKQNEAAMKLCRLVGAHLIANDGKTVTYILSKSDLQGGVSYRT